MMGIKAVPDRKNVHNGDAKEPTQDAASVVPMCSGAGEIR